MTEVGFERLVFFLVGLAACALHEHAHEHCDDQEQECECVGEVWIGFAEEDEDRGGANQEGVRDVLVDFYFLVVGHSVFLIRVQRYKKI